MAQGTLTNGWTHTGAISPVGDSDSWSFSASLGDRILIRVGEITQVNNFTPRIRLFNPSSTLLATASGPLDAEIAVTSTNGGVFTVVVDDAVGTTATGTYRLTLVKAPGDVFVAPGDEGGPMTNALQYAGTIQVGDLDVWTFSAKTGDGIVLRMGSTGYNPFLRLYGPDGALVKQAYDTSAGVRDADLQMQTTNTGVFTVVASSLYANGTGPYILTLAHAPAGDTPPDAITLSPGDQGGPMTNAYQHTGFLDIGDIDVWSFTAHAGDGIVLRMGATGYNPWIRLFGPDGAFVKQSYDSSSGVRDTDLYIQVTNSGIFTVVAASLSQNGTGNYILTLAHAPAGDTPPDAITLSPGDQGGPMTNAFQHTGFLDIGDIDVWSFTAHAGDGIVLRMGATGYNPWIRLFGPNGALVKQAYDSSSGVRDTDLYFQATNSGVFTVVAASLYQNGTGDYILTLAHAPLGGAPPDAITLSPGDQGGLMTNGFQHTGFLEIGDIDVWSFSAHAGEGIVLRMGATGYNPWIRLFGPDGAFVKQSYDSSSGVRDTDLPYQATNSGVFTVVVASLYQNGTGNYILTLAHASPGGAPPDALAVAPGDEGGAMTNGYRHNGFLDIGDLDAWSFSANAGDGIALRMGTTNAYNPWIRLYGPSGALIGQGYDTSSGIRDADLRVQATNSGAYLVVASSLYQNGTGYYILTLGRSPGAIAVSPGDEGGTMTNGFQYLGSIDVGDLDVWNFGACKGNLLSLKGEELSGGNSFTPRLRLFGPTGALLVSAQNATTTLINYQTTNSGTFTLLVDGGVLNNIGTYRLTGSGLAADGLTLCSPRISGAVLNVTGIGGAAGADGILYSSTNVTTSLSLWTPLRTNQFDQFGVFAYTNAYSSAEQTRFFRLLQQ